MAAYVYEGMMILDSNRYTRDPAAAAAQVSAIIEEAGGEVLVSRLGRNADWPTPFKDTAKGPIGSPTSAWTVPSWRRSAAAAT